MIDCRTLHSDAESVRGNNTCCAKSGLDAWSGRRIRSLIPPTKIWVRREDLERAGHHSLTTEDPKRAGNPLNRCQRDPRWFIFSGRKARKLNKATGCKGASNHVIISWGGGRNRKPHPAKVGIPRAVVWESCLRSVLVTKLSPLRLLHPRSPPRRDAQ